MFSFSRVLIAGFVLTGSGAAFAASEFSRESWIADFEQLKAAMTAGYPSLEWAAQRGMDLPALEKRARDRLAEAGDDAAARTALERFIAAFGDGHMSLTWPATGSAPAAPAKPSTRPLCAKLDYPNWPDTTAIARGLSGYRALEVEGPLSAGTVASNGKNLAVLRVPLFMADASLCEDAVRALEIDASAPCNDECRDLIERHADTAFVGHMAAAIRALAATKPDLLLVDVAGNGGGNDSAIALARMLTTAPLASPRMGFLRGPARANKLQEDALGLKSGLKGAGSAEKKFVLPLLENLEAARREAGEPCDLAPLWQAKPVTCTNLLSKGFFGGGLVDQELPAQWRRKPWAEQAAATSRYDYEPALWTGRLVVLVDSNSGSATELLTAMLLDAGRAEVIGAPTAGAGCGWTLPRVTTELSNSKGKLVMPDCVRLRKDGSNELDGIQPGLLIGFRRYDSPRQRVQRLEAVLPRLLAP